MQREIKFRAWDGKQMMDVPVNHSGYRLNELLEGILENYKLMQSTGLKDKNGVEIYEGDIVRDRPGNKVIVIYEAPSFKPDRSFDGFNAMARWIEVIGNIYENPELLTPNQEQQS